ncbi:AAA family ATPase [Dorea longicatena]|nr:AAA family ATPase [Dorea longicatena]
MMIYRRINYMILKKIKIMNYRQLQSVELDMQDSLTVLAGPNNSGKTTLISVLKGMFCDKKLGFSYSDIPISLSSMWLDKTVPVFQKIMLEYDKEKGVQKIIDEMTDNNKFSNDYTMDNFQAQIQVDYDPDNDNIQYFADYLMDLDDTKHSFYFIYTYEPSITAFEKGLNERYDRMAARVRDIANPGCIEKETKFYFLKEELLRIYCNAVIEKCYFCNSNYKNENLMEVAAFKSLFNFQNIPAMRELDDNESDSSKGISKRVIALLKDNDTWVEATKKLPDLLMADIEDSGAKKEIKNSSIKSLDDTIRDISKTSGGHIGKLQLEMDVKEQDVEEFIRRITRAKYDVEGLLLNEESQGLGFSNLIYLHMRLEEFYKSIDKNKVNVFFIEEPESHMHPQMQNVFVRFLKNYYIDKKLQGLITTHSNEIARVVGLDSLRVIRQTEKSKSELFDLSKFRTSIKEKKIENLDDESEFLLTNFFDWFFEIGYSELIFADKAILYEGDSERLYIRKLIKLPEFSTLNDSYIAYIQVGGAYAHNYLPMLRMLKMKTLIITDLDYDKEILSMDKVKAEDSKSTNATINHCYRLVYPNKEENYFPTIKELYDFQVKEENILCDGRVYLAFQDEDSTARTLEEAMLKKILGFNVFHMIKRSEWKKIRKDKNLIFSIPNNKKGEKDSEYSIRKIVEATSNNKTDFMYSVILSENEEKMLPDYIKKGLLWLMK